MGRKPGSKNKHSRKNHRSACKWCGADFAHFHTTTETCSPVCRHRLRHYRDALGFDPDRPMGDMVPSAAVAEVVAALVAAERYRRSTHHTTPHHPCA